MWTPRGDVHHGLRRCELKDAMDACAGLWFDFVYQYIPGSQSSQSEVRWRCVDTKTVAMSLKTWMLAAGAALYLGSDRVRYFINHGVL